MQITLTIRFANIGVNSNIEAFQLEIRGNKPLPKFAPNTKYKPSFKPITPVARKLTDSRTIAKLEYER